MNIVLLKECFHKIKKKQTHKKFIINLFQLISSSEIIKWHQAGSKNLALNIYLLKVSD